MNKQIRIVLSFILCFVFVGALGNAPQAQAAPAVPPQPHEYLSKNGDTVSIKATDSNIASMAPFTQERRQAAKPMALTTLTASDLKNMPAAPSSGAPGSKAGGMADQAALEKAKADNPDAWAAQNNRQSLDQFAQQAPSLDQMYGTKNTWTGYLGNYFSPFYTTYPYRTVGQLFFTDGYSDYACSATLINYDVIVTAAHCVYNTDYNYWYYGFQFVPAYMNGNAPFGYTNWYSALVLTKWMTAKKSSAGLSNDVALIELYDNIGYSTGWMGYAYNASPKNMQHAIGYPSNLTGGYYTYICVAESFSGKGGLGMGCDMTYGSSGGPWVLWLIPFQDAYPYTAYGNYIDAVVSGGTPGTPTFYGPRFTNKNILPLCWTFGWC